MAVLKRDSQGIAKRPAVRNEYTPMFEFFRDELDEHHDRRDRLGKASRDVTALSKKAIFALQRVREISPELPPDIQSQVDAQLKQIAPLLASMAPEVHGLCRHRYARSMQCLEELVEALSFAHYLRTQRLISPAELAATVSALTRQGRSDSDDGAAQAVPELTEQDYLLGLFDLTGEMMRFATTSSALTGALATAGQHDTQDRPRTIVQDMQELGSFFGMMPPRQKDKAWNNKMEVLMQSVRKVERIGYDRAVRGGERPAGWVPEVEFDAE